MTMGDLCGQLASCTIGERGLCELADQYEATPLREIMTRLADYTERLVRQEIASWPDGTVRFEDFLDSAGIDERSVRIAVADDPR